MKPVRERMDMTSAYREVGSYRGAAEICGTTHRTVKKAVLAAQRAEAGLDPPMAHNYDSVRDVVAERVQRTKGKISAKRLLPVVRAAGYEGSARNLRRLVAETKIEWRRENHRGRRPGVWTPGDMLVFDWGEIGPLFVFCAVVAWSRVRFVSFTDNLGAEATMTALAECFEYIGGVPKTALTDRMGCLKGGTVAGLVIPTPAYVRFATHYRFQPDFCEGADPESKGLAENLVGYVKSDLMIPEELTVGDLVTANAKGRVWLDEVNAVEHSEICAVPFARLAIERKLFSALPALRATIGKIVIRTVSKLSCVRFGSARYSVPMSHIGREVELRVRDGVITIVVGEEVIAEHLVVSPGEASVDDAHYGGPRPLPTRAVRPKSAAEKAFCALGPAAETFIKGAAAKGMTGLARDLDELCQLEAIHGREPVIAALERAVAFSRFRAADVVSILDAGHGAPRPTRSGEALIIELPSVPVRSLSDYAIGEQS
jgi:transposase